MRQVRFENTQDALTHLASHSHEDHTGGLCLCKTCPPEPNRVVQLFSCVPQIIRHKRNGFDVRDFLPCRLCFSDGFGALVMAQRMFGLSKRVALPFAALHGFCMVCPQSTHVVVGDGQEGYAGQTGWRLLGSVVELA